MLHSHHKPAAPALAGVVVADNGVLQLEEELAQCWRVAWDRKWAGEAFGCHLSFALSLSSCLFSFWLRVF